MLGLVPVPSRRPRELLLGFVVGFCVVFALTWSVA